MHSAPKHLTDSRTTNFYYSFLFLPREKRRAIEAVYHFARHGDDAADGLDNPGAAPREVAKCRALLDRCYQNGCTNFDDPAHRALAEAIRRFQIPRQPFEDLLLGLEMDLRMDRAGTVYRTFEDLELYCYRVASAIGLIAIEIFQYQNPQTREYAITLGRALQMVNILRDSGSDAVRGRVYLPQEDLERFGVDARNLTAGRCDDSFMSLMRFEIARTRAFFDRARQLLPAEDRAAMKPAQIMGAIYWRLLREIERRPFDVLVSQIQLSRPMKLWTALSVFCGAEWQR